MRIFSLGDDAVTIEFGNEISLDLNRKAIALSEHIESDSFPGFVETVPAYSSTTIFFNPGAVREHFADQPSAFAAVAAFAREAYHKLNYGNESEQAPIEIPVSFDPAAASDLEELCKFTELESVEVISLFLERTYRVFMIGFLPGFAYMGEVDERIAVPRKPTPRLKVPAGSVGIAGKQTGIYPLESPGGWQIIGRTEMKMFDPLSEPNCPLRAGDLVKFVRI